MDEDHSFDQLDRMRCDLISQTIDTTIYAINDQFQILNCKLCKLKELYSLYNRHKYNPSEKTGMRRLRNYKTYSEYTDLLFIKNMRHARRLLMKWKNIDIDNLNILEDTLYMLSNILHEFKKVISCITHFTRIIERN